MAAEAKKDSQNIIAWICWAVYTFAYLGRYSYNANINLIIADYNITKAEAGLVVTFFFFAYGIGQVLNGLLVKHYNKKIMFPVAFLLSSIFNLLVFFGAPFAFVKYIWLLNGIIQSCFWPTLISVLSENLDKKHLDGAISLTGTSAVCGTIFIYGISALFVKLGNYKISFLFAAIMMLAIGTLWLFVYSPTEVNTQTEETKKEETKKSFFNTIGLIIVLLAIFAVVDNLVKDGLTTWVPAILKEKYMMKDEMAILSTLVLPCLGVFGTLLSVKLNEYVRDFVSLSTLLLAVSAMFLGAFAVFENMNVIVMVICFGIVLCLMHSINTVITAIAPLKLRDKVNSGKMAGVLNGFCYLGSTISSYGLGLVADKGGWGAVFWLLFAVSIVVLLMGAIFMVRKILKS